MIARESFEKSLPRFASAAPFLCLIDDHLLCPDTHRLLHRLEEQLVHARIVGQLGMERRDEEAALPQEDWLAVALGEHLDPVSVFAHARGAGDNYAQRLRVALQCESV